MKEESVSHKEDKYKDENITGSFSKLLDWISHHKIFTIVLIILIIIGAEKVIKHFKKD